MAIQINGSTVIDNSENLILDGSVSGGIIATTAEAQAATADDVIMTPAKVKDLLQGGNASVIKSITRFTVTAGFYAPGGGFAWGGATINRSTGSSVSINSPDGSSAYFSFAILGTPVNPNKTFLTFSDQAGPFSLAPLSGILPSATAKTRVRLYSYFAGVGRYPTTAETSWTQIQISSSGYIPYETSTGLPFEPPEVSVEVIEFY